MLLFVFMFCYELKVRRFIVAATTKLIPLSSITYLRMDADALVTNPSTSRRMFKYWHNIVLELIFSTTP